MIATPPTFTIDAATKLFGKVVVESPFRTYPCKLNDFYGGAFSYISPGVRFHRTRIGRYCSIGDGVYILSQHPTTTLSSSPVFYQTLFASPFISQTKMSYDNLAQTTIGNDVWIGSDVKIKTGVTIGDGAVIGAGSVVTKNVVPFSIVGGVPAKLIKMRFATEIIDRIQALQWWQYNLLNYEMQWDNLEKTLLMLETLKANGELMPYIAPRFQLQHENGKIVVKSIS